ncbi:hypothetical protein BurJ1DRAFT_1917 [Burkholderiales bacterium JOSHI_001]|nr:hypothetical protein BurJ1DRAFT_1917 [Burkholderiales bacterium JOSHI_001]
MQYRRIRYVCSIALIAIVAACATATPPTQGVPAWDFERDELKIINQELVIGALIGGIIGGNREHAAAEAVLGRGATRGSSIESIAQDRIELSPQELSTILFSTLNRGQSIRSRGAVISLAPQSTTDGADARSPNNTTWSISESNEGQLSTDWKRITGRRSGVLWWEKQYQTEVHHIISIKRAFQNSRFTNFSIQTEVRERPNESYPWSAGDPELGRESFESIKRLLVSTVREEINRRRVKR